ncbi:hypothetical protein [Archangium violaceum]|uniref:Uncharacterized protein n=1 Tax=Archangium violaceum Cb vi76 TaxID=1406225 RepID=A0A084SVQ9_9BACT|nr:hypothetical protein [Archangium violaceum]KFA92544.1 hypothetical protein Q664_14705 [Archangium violaceum Cb vi76]
MPPSTPPETPEPVASERPRLIINGEPFPPEDLCRSLSPSVLLRLSVTKEPYVPPEPRRPMPLPERVEALPARTLAVILVLLGLGLAALILL